MSKAEKLCSYACFAILLFNIHIAGSAANYFVGLNAGLEDGDKRVAQCLTNHGEIAWLVSGFTLAETLDFYYEYLFVSFAISLIFLMTARFGVAKNFIFAIGFSASILFLAFGLYFSSTIVIQKQHLSDQLDDRHLHLRFQELDQLVLVLTSMAVIFMLLALALRLRDRNKIANLK